jgi:hypothetical protein
MLTNRQTAFVNHYVLTGRGAYSARESGFSKHTARTISSFLLTKVDIQREIRLQRAILAKKLDVSKEQVLINMAAACEVAREQGRPDLMIAASREIGRLCGYYSEPTKDTSQPKELSGMTDEQLYALLAESQ